MREIKFRAIVQGENKFTYSNGFMKHKDGIVIIITKELDEYVETSPIIENTLCQFTGLKDKNGVDIYEGDIVNFKANYTNKPCGYFNGVVKITPYELLLVVGEFEYNASEETDEFPYSKCEVIGNVYENPELL